MAVCVASLLDGDCKLDDGDGRGAAIVARVFCEGRHAPALLKIEGRFDSTRVFLVESVVNGSGKLCFTIGGLPDISLHVPKISLRHDLPLS